ncbi:hypothetical protein BDM02DRAFT_1003302 [Thelephora ganbajun]|uniref:Uncharacterized protein n=1 Tax=Thelephora ganbajun TaxID=370292 RepID=A0ACB6ZP94_THEGA|nr:hypothetical protein BDM02DRAFT_1003302 [Thelephora ganbajun]
MKPGPNKKRDNPKVDANVAPEDNGAPGHKPISLDEVQEHIEQLRGIGTVTARLFALLGEQITAVSSTAPVQRGRKTVEELKNQANAHRDGLKQAFDPLREQIERLKNNFWEKNGDVIEATAKKYVERKVKERVLVEVEKAIERYRDHIEKNEQRNQKLRDVVHAS